MFKLRKLITIFVLVTFIMTLLPAGLVVSPVMAQETLPVIHAFTPQSMSIDGMKEVVIYGENFAGQVDDKDISLKSVKFGLKEITASQLIDGVPNLEVTDNGTKIVVRQAPSYDNNDLVTMVVT
ncbi:MAG: IPT/TIG domain-containing protein, partial [Bacillota bacterium]|nr:IPT/TIG domain-containing protein [Bacillota bacterium]